MKGVRLARHIKDRNEVRVENESEYEHKKRGCEKIERTNWKMTKRGKKLASMGQAHETEPEHGHENKEFEMEDDG